ncbi:MAG: diacylglycerol kinase family protein [Acidobacteriota bacterium]|nr:diacylglycerol kinase family protein [Acidobacteriota bacterium]
MEFVCVVNPVSGRGRSVKVAGKLKERLVNDGHQVRILETSGDSEKFSRICDSIKASDRVICIGGDGTLLYFLNHCFQYRSVAFYGVGTANVISIEFGIPRRIDRFVRMLEDDYRIMLHPGVTDNGTRFLMMCSFGIDGMVLNKVSQLGKNRMGKLAFLWPVFRSMTAYDYPKRGVSLDDGPMKDAYFAVISRIQHYGGPFRIAPDADPSKPSFQVVQMDRKGFWPTLRLLFHLMIGRVPSCPGVSVDSAEKVVISSGVDLMYFQVDGDLFPGEVKELKVLPDSFPLVIPQPER